MDKKFPRAGNIGLQCWPKAVMGQIQTKLTRYRVSASGDWLANRGLSPGLALGERSESADVRIEVIGMTRIRSQAVALVALWMVTACWQALPVLAGDTKPAPPSAATPSPDAVSAKTAFWEMYKLAHSWASDLVPLKVESKTVPGMRNGAGKAVKWTATFGSPSRHEARVFTYSAVTQAPDTRKGVTVGNPLPWPGPTRDALPFDTGDFAVDSDAVYNAAFAQASTWAKAHPDKEVTLSLGNASRFPAPVWYVLWGDSKSGYAVFVNAKSGAVINQK
jgi:hypothetical protein